MPTGIDWTDETWNPVTGCTKISAGCKNCYAEPLAERLKRMGQKKYQAGFHVIQCWPDALTIPFRWKEPKKVFVNSMGDLLHKDVPNAFIAECFSTMRQCSRHEFQILTKRADRWPSVYKGIGVIPENILCGVSIENKKQMKRLIPLGQIKARKVVSFEPLLEDLGSPSEIARQLMDAGINWVITGGESGYKARPAELSWFRNIRDACQGAGVAFFHKQHGGKGTSHKAKRGGEYAVLDGRIWQEYPFKSEKQHCRSEIKQTELF